MDLQRTRSAATQVASGDYSIIGGGLNNTASSGYSTVSGGTENIASGYLSVVMGGHSNTANANFVIVFGENVDPSATETHRVYLLGDGSITPSRPSGFLVLNRLDGDYPIHVGTTTTNGNGAYLTTGGTRTNGSSRAFKDRFIQLDPQTVLTQLAHLPVEGWYYKGTQEYHIGPYAEDFYATFSTGVHEIIETDSTGQLIRRPNPEVSHYLAPSDMAGVALLGIQGLVRENEALRQRVQVLESTVSELQARLARLEAQMSRP